MVKKIKIILLSTTSLLCQTYGVEKLTSESDYKIDSYIQLCQKGYQQLQTIGKKWLEYAKSDSKNQSDRDKAKSFERNIHTRFRNQPINHANYIRLSAKQDYC